MSYKTPHDPEFQKILVTGVREAIEPLSKPERAVWQPLLTSLVFSLARDAQVEEAQRARRSQHFHPAREIDGAPQPLTASQAPGVVASMVQAFKQCLQEGGPVKMTEILAQTQVARTASLKQMNIESMAKLGLRPAPVAAEIS